MSKVHFAKWVNLPNGKSGHLSSCGIWNPPSMVYFTLRSDVADEYIKKIDCIKCLNKTTLRDLV